MDFVDLFCGAGLVTEGLKSIGLSPRLGVDNWPHALRTYRARHGNNFLCKDLLVPGGVAEALYEGGIPPSFDGLIWLSPPCQELSHARGASEVPCEVVVRAFNAIAEAAEYAPGAWVVVENVPSFLARKHRGLRQTMSRRVSKARNRSIFFSAGVAATGAIDDAYMSRYCYLSSEYGIAQSRRRLIFPIPPRGEEVPDPELRKSIKDISLEKVIGNGFSDPDNIAPQLSDMEARLFDGMPPGGNWRDTEASREYALRKYGNRTPPEAFLRRSAWDDVPPCVLAGKRVWLKTGNFVHPDELRRFTLGETRAFQSIPKDYWFAGEPDMRLRQIGNAVPPPLAALVVKKFLKKSLTLQSA